MRLIILVSILIVFSSCTLQQIKDAEVVYCNPILQAGRTVARAGLTAVTGVHMIDVCQTVEQMTDADEG